MVLILKLLSLLLTSGVLSAVLIIGSIVWVENNYTPAHTWSGYNLYGLLVIFPVALPLLFIALCIWQFSQGLVQLTMAIPIWLLVIFVGRLWAYFL